MSFATNGGINVKSYNDDNNNAKPLFLSKTFTLMSKVLKEDEKLVILGLICPWILGKYG